MIKFKEKYNNDYSSLLMNENEKFNYKKQFKSKKVSIVFKSNYTPFNDDDNEYCESDNVQLKEILWDDIKPI